MRIRLGYNDKERSIYTVCVFLNIIHLEMLVEHTKLCRIWKQIVLR